MKMSITRALAELKLLDKRINTTLNSGQLVNYAVGDKPVTGYATNQEFESKAQSIYQSTLDLIKRRNEIKSAIVLSNATTEVEIAGVKYKVAEAIERKTSIAYDQSLLRKMKQDFAGANNNIEHINEQVKQQIDHQLQAFLSADSKVKNSINDDLTKAYREKNEAKLIDPLKIRDKFEKLEKEIDEFLSEVDYVLSTSNTLTEIEVSE